jgi:hypothetical protein
VDPAVNKFSKENSMIMFQKPVPCVTYSFSLRIYNVACPIKRLTLVFLRHITVVPLVETMHKVQGNYVIKN